MRILFTFTGGVGHFRPLLPLARAAAARGDAVMFSCQQAMMGFVTAAGFAAVDSGGKTIASPDFRGALQPTDRTREATVIRETFAGRVASERAARLRKIASDWQADVLVRDEVDFGAAVAAESLGLPHVCVIVLAAGAMITPDLISEPMNALRSDYGLPADPHLAMLHRYLTLAPLPPTYRSTDDPLPATARHIQPAALDRRAFVGRSSPATARTLDWLGQRPGRATVYITLGTIFHQESGDLLPRILAAVCDLDGNVVATVGSEIDPAELGPQPETVRIERFIPQEALLPHCDLVISHAGSGSVLGALAFGVPLVLLPIGADQPRNAARCHSLQVAEILDPITADDAAVSSAVSTVLTNPIYRNAAKQLRDEAAALPTADEAAQWIANLVDPILS
ncbi:glycosyltransferase [Jatrophihabitans sp. GAS493]|uniref:glycosyltransferase n=1 Tax=Jatrophihabitans sp. GAS493 TaxID=1907575 RepID=UPI000BB6B9A7|nr:glycosyltransferase [Jatrophihabitans sp. GAS493]